MLQERNRLFLFLFLAIGVGAVGITPGVKFIFPPSTLTDSASITVDPIIVPFSGTLFAPTNNQVFTVGDTVSVTGSIAGGTAPYEYAGGTIVPGSGNIATRVRDDLYNTVALSQALRIVPVYPN